MFNYRAMPNYKKCPQDTDHYCPHYKSECEEAKNDRVMCVHLVASARSTLALSAVIAIAEALSVGPATVRAIEESLREMAIPPDLKVRAWLKWGKRF